MLQSSGKYQDSKILAKSNHIKEQTNCQNKANDGRHLDNNTLTLPVSNQLIVSKFQSM